MKVYRSTAHSSISVTVVTGLRPAQPVFLSAAMARSVLLGFSANDGSGRLTFQEELSSDGQDLPNRVGWNCHAGPGQIRALATTYSGHWGRCATDVAGVTYCSGGLQIAPGSRVEEAQPGAQTRARFRVCTRISTACIRVRRRRQRPVF